MKIIIIGAGISGLSAAIYALKNGYEVDVYEKHSLPGGLCTSWKRKDYIFEGSLHWLTGSGQKSSFHKYWKELGIIENLKFFMPDEFFRIEKDGKVFSMFTDIDRLRNHMLEISPEDSILINEFINDIKLFSKFNLNLDKPYTQMNIIDIFKMIRSMKPFMKTMKKYSVTLKEFASHFKNPLLCDGMKCAIPEGYPVTSLLFTLAGFVNGDNMITYGGALNFVEKLADKVISSGGKIYYNKPVSKIVIERNKYKSIILEDGTEVFSDYIISSADPHFTRFKLLSGNYMDKKIEKLFTDGTTYSSVQVSIGVDADLSKYPHWRNISLEKPVKIGNIEFDYIPFRHYSYDPAIAPKGKSSVISLLFSNYDYWKNLGYNSADYKTEKERICNIIKEELEKNYPETKGKIEVIDIATPCTFERYTNVWKGSYMGWYTIPFKNSYAPVSDTIKGISNLYQIGMWTSGTGGLPTAMISGRWSIQNICKKDKKIFKC